MAAPWSVTVTIGQARTTPRVRPICNLSRPSPVQGMTNCAWRNAHVHTPACRAFVVPWALQSMDTHTRRSQPLGYELTSDSLTSILRSQKLRSRPIARLGHDGPFHVVSAVAPRFVPKSVPIERLPESVVQGKPLPADARSQSAIACSTLYLRVTPAQSYIRATNRSTRPRRVLVMSDDDARKVIETHAQALGPALHSGVATSLAAARQRTRGLAHDRHPHLLPLTVRAELREHLERERLPSGWEVGGDSRLMGQLLLNNPELGMQMRFVKERRSSSRWRPHRRQEPGASRAMDSGPAGPGTAPRN
jgi:hypothetical protein